MLFPNSEKVDSSFNRCINVNRKDVQEIPSDISNYWKSIRQSNLIYNNTC